MTDFGVETIHLDLPPLVGALSRRLHDAGMPTTPARSADLARALALVRPVSRRRLYWTARAVLVSDPAQVKVFDAVFHSIFGNLGEPEPFEPDDTQYHLCRPGRPAGGRPQDAGRRLGGARRAPRRLVAAARCGGRR